MRNITRTTPDYQFSADRTSMDNMRRLVAHRPFQKAVVIARLQWFGIPAWGFAKDDHGRHAWILKIHLERERMLAFVRFAIYLAEIYNVPAHFVPYIREHVLHGTTRAPLDNFESGSFPKNPPMDFIEAFSFSGYAQLTKIERDKLHAGLEHMDKLLNR